MDEENEIKIGVKITVDEDGYHVDPTIGEEYTHEDVALMIMALRETEHSLIHRRLEEI